VGEGLSTERWLGAVLLGRVRLPQSIQSSVLSKLGGEAWLGCLPASNLGVNVSLDAWLGCLPASNLGVNVGLDGCLGCLPVSNLCIHISLVSGKLGLKISLLGRVVIAVGEGLSTERWLGAVLLGRVRFPQSIQLSARL